MSGYGTPSIGAEVERKTVRMKSGSLVIMANLNESMMAHTETMGICKCRTDQEDMTLRAEQWEPHHDRTQGRRIPSWRCEVLTGWLFVRRRPKRGCDVPISRKARWPILTKYALLSQINVRTNPRAMVRSISL